MRAYVDTWITSADEATIKEICATYENVLGPVESNGLWYACVRSDKNMAFPGNISVITQGEGKTVLGVWA